jgi:hypothetical protein
LKSVENHSTGDTSASFLLVLDDALQGLLVRIEVRLVGPAHRV